jgi:hypothetical protein
MASIEPAAVTMSIWTHKTRPQLRRFGLAFGGGLTLLSTLLWWRDKPLAPWTFGAAAAIVLMALLAPRLLAPLEWLLERIFKAVTAVVTYLILTLVYFVVMTPVGLVLRAFGRDTFGKRFDRTRASYWQDVTEDGPGSRPDRPY